MAGSALGLSQGLSAELPAVAACWELGRDPGRAGQRQLRHCAVEQSSRAVQNTGRDEEAGAAPHCSIQYVCLSPERKKPCFVSFFLGHLIATTVIREKMGICSCGAPAGLCALSCPQHSVLSMPGSCGPGAISQPGSLLSSQQRAAGAGILQGAAQAALGIGPAAASPCCLGGNKAKFSAHLT